MFTLIADCFILLAGVAYPAYASFKAIKYRSVNGYVRWMCYWVVYAAYSICERTLGTYLLFWVPGYDLLRCLFVLWLVAPFTRGAQLLYKHIVHPQLSKHEAHVDTVCANYSEALKQGSTGLLRYAAGVFFQSLMKANALLFSYVQTHSLAQRRANVGQIQYGNAPLGGFYQSAVYPDQPVVGHPPALLARPAFAAYPDQFGYAHGPSADYFAHASVQRTFSMESLTDGFEYVDRPPPRSRSTSENEQVPPATGARMHESVSQPVRIGTPKTQLRTLGERPTQTQPPSTTIPTTTVVQRTVQKDEAHSSVAKRSSPPPGGSSTKKSIVSAALNAFERATSKK